MQCSSFLNARMQCSLYDAHIFICKESIYVLQTYIYIFTIYFHKTSGSQRYVFNCNLCTQHANRLSNAVHCHFAQSGINYAKQRIQQQPQSGINIRIMKAMHEPFVQQFFASPPPSRTVFSVLALLCFVGFTMWSIPAIVGDVAQPSFKRLVGCMATLGAAVQSMLLSFATAGPPQGSNVSSIEKACNCQIDIKRKNQSAVSTAAEAEGIPSTDPTKEEYDELEGGFFSLRSWVFAGKVVLQSTLFLLVLAPLAALQILCLGTVALGWNLILMATNVIFAPPILLIYALFAVALAYGIVTTSPSLSNLFSSLNVRLTFMLAWVSVLTASFFMYDTPDFIENIANVDIASDSLTIPIDAMDTLLGIP